jgi:SOS-response transcriptional repressor LexA
MAKNIEGRFDEPLAAPDEGQAARQTGLQEIIRDFRDEWGEAPTIRDLCRILGVEWTSAMEDNLKALEHRGLLRRARD